MVMELGTETLAEKLESKKESDKKRMYDWAKQLIAAVVEIHEGDRK